MLDVLYMRHPSVDVVADALTARRPEMKAQILRRGDNPWLEIRGCHQLSWWDVEDLLLDLSGALACEGVHVRGKDHLDLSYASKGEMIRELEYSHDEGGWTRVRGTPQPWEEVLLDGVAEQILDDPEPSAADQRVLDTRTLQEGADYPGLSRLDIVALGDTIGLSGFWNDGEDPPIQMRELNRGMLRTPAAGLPLGIGLMALPMLLSGAMPWMLDREHWLVVPFGWLLIALAVAGCAQVVRSVA